jgi:hypothetical protein
MESISEMDNRITDIVVSNPPSVIMSLYTHEIAMALQKVPVSPEDDSNDEQTMRIHTTSMKLTEMLFEALHNNRSNSEIINACELIELFIEIIDAFCGK